LSSYRLIKILNFFPRIIRKTNYLVIGGYFPKGLSAGIYQSSYYENLNRIVVEGEMLKNEIVANHSLRNVEVISNFKKFNFEPRIKESQKLPIQFVFISLITEDKGCDTIFNAIRILNASGFAESFTVSFYGKIDEIYKEKFLGQIGNNIYYKGYLDLMKNPDESYLELSNYNCLLFPSYFKGEGFPGVLIDSFIAGLPTIASDWNMNTELVIHEKNGMVVSAKNELELAKAMQRMIESPKWLAEMSINARSCASNFHIDSVWPGIQNIIEN
jgi:glycosyltransferase involved in cell wall biosynthesis